MIAEHGVLLSMTDDDDLYLDTAVQMMEALAVHFEELGKAFSVYWWMHSRVAKAFKGEARQVVCDSAHDV